uniref:Type II inositol 1,4,5-trisphosphate 5-phosphatase n=1 Tax=Cacopsylla melanoneura TaxID=428564 RepID=A0A8D8YIL8_9HEMI
MNSVQKLLSSDETIISSHDVSLVQGWMRSSKNLIILEKNRDLKALLVVSETVDYALPIDSDFKFDIDSESKSKNAGDVFISISYQKHKLLFEMLPPSKANTFINELLRAMEHQSRRKTAGDYSWLKKYSNKTDLSLENQGVVMDASKLLLDYNEHIPRHSVARGAMQPVAARDSVIKYQMGMMEDEYTYTQGIQIFIGTWNVNGQSPSVSLSDWLSFTTDPPHVYAIGFQELDLSKEAFLFNETPKEGEWLRAVTKSLHPGAVYKEICLVRLVGMMLIVFVEENLAQHVDHVACDSVGTGIMGKLGNKGGVAIRLDLHTTSLCFVNSHLAAHTEEYERRNQDYHDIDSRIAFTGFLPPKSIKDHDQIYWLGDLNYRITELDLLKVKSLINLGKYEVLYRGEGIRQLVDYTSIPILKISDHKPVIALFNSDIRLIDNIKYRKIHEEVMKKLDKLENEFLPQVMVDSTEVNFDTLRFLEAQNKTLIIANTGQVPVQFEFIKKCDDSNYCKDWLHIDPYMGFILPGEKCDVKLEVYVDKRCASKMNSGQDKVYDILVLHLEGGKDLFITVQGTYERSVFGCSIETLVHLNVPLREISLGKLIELERSKDSSSVTSTYSVPKEIWFLVDHLYRHGLKQQNLFEHPGLPSEILLIRNWLDTGSTDPIPGSVHSVAESLLLLLESTAEPLVPYNLHEACLAASTSYLQCKQLISSLPLHCKNVYLYLCSFLQELLSHSDENGLDGKTIATLFGQIFLRDSPRSRNDQSARGRSNQTKARKKANFVYHFLVNDFSDLISPVHVS